MITEEMISAINQIIESKTIAEKEELAKLFPGYSPHLGSTIKIFFNKWLTEKDLTIKEMLEERIVNSMDRLYNKSASSWTEEDPLLNTIDKILAEKDDAPQKISLLYRQPSWLEEEDIVPPGQEALPEEIVNQQKETVPPGKIKNISKMISKFIKVAQK